MKKKSVIFLTGILAALLTMSVAAASDGSEYVFCTKCGSSLATMGTHVASWQDTHLVPTNLVVNGETVYERCTRIHDTTRMSKYCPTGHWTAWSATKHQINHSVCNDEVIYE